MFSVRADDLNDNRGQIMNANPNAVSDHRCADVVESRRLNSSRLGQTQFVD